MYIFPPRSVNPFMHVTAVAHPSFTSICSVPRVVAEAVLVFPCSSSRSQHFPSRSNSMFLSLPSLVIVAEVGLPFFSNSSGNRVTPIFSNSSDSPFAHSTSASRVPVEVTAAQLPPKVMPADYHTAVLRCIPLPPWYTLCWPETSCSSLCPTDAEIDAEGSHSGCHYLMTFMCSCSCQVKPPSPYTQSQQFPGPNLFTAMCCPNMGPCSQSLAVIVACQCFRYCWWLADSIKCHDAT